MSKTAETVLAEITEQDVKEFSPSIIRKDKAFYVREDSVIQAMHAYAEKTAVEFAGWCRLNATPSLLINHSWIFESNYYTSEQLFELFTQQNQK